MADRGVAGCPRYGFPDLGDGRGPHPSQDVDDEMVHDAAINGCADVIVTHNLRDFLPAASQFNFRVVSPTSFIGEVLK
jgi:predicted nucleic acid-binding protein